MVCPSDTVGPFCIPSALPFTTLRLGQARRTQPAIGCFRRPPAPRPDVLVSVHAQPAGRARVRWAVAVSVLKSQLAENCAPGMLTFKATAQLFILDARGVWESCRWVQLPTSWPTSSPSSTACRASPSSWCTASLASRYHYPAAAQDSSHPHPSHRAVSDDSKPITV
nr:uncharacterized protein LOC106829108 isoform X5 [Equus asinus]